MKRLREFLLLTLLGGLGVVLPLLLFFLLLRWLLDTLRSLAAPLADTLLPGLDAQGAAAPLVLLALLTGACFVIGLVVRTRLGSLLHGWLEERFARLAPGYRMVRDIVTQLLGSGEREFLRGEVALVCLQPASPWQRQVAIVTARHGDAGFTVYVPTAPIPTQGFVYHLPSANVEILTGVSIQSAMRMIIACGAGANEVLPAQLFGPSTCFENGGPS